MKKRNCPIGARLVIPASFSECFTYEKQILWLKNSIDNISGGADPEVIANLQNQINSLERIVNNLQNEVSDLDVEAINQSIAQMQLNIENVTAALSDKQDKLTFDSAPTAGSENPVTSGGIQQAIYDEGMRLEQLINDKVSEDVFNQAYNNIINNYVTNDELDERLAGVGEYTVDFDVENFHLSSLYYTGGESNIFSSTSIDRVYIKGNEPVYSDGNFWYLHTTVCADLTLVASRTSSYSRTDNLSLVLEQSPISDFVYAHDKGFSSLSGNVTHVENNKTIPLFLPRVDENNENDCVELTYLEIIRYNEFTKKIKYFRGLNLVSGTNTLKFHIESRCVFCKSTPFTIDTVFD